MAILCWVAALILSSRPLLLGLQLHGPFLLKRMSLEGGTKGFIIHSSGQAQHRQNRAFPLLPPPESRQASPAAPLHCDHLQMKSCRRHPVPRPSCPPPPQEGSPPGKGLQKLLIYDPVISAHDVMGRSHCSST